MGFLTLAQGWNWHPDNLQLAGQISKSNDPEVVALELVHKKYLAFENKTVKKSHFDFLNDTDVFIALPDIILESVVKDGYKNVYELPAKTTSKKEGYLIKRKKLEDTFLNAPLNDNSLHPKYAIWQPKDTKVTEYASRPSPNYGNVLLFLKQHVKDRSTFSLSDSYNHRLPPQKLRTFHFQSAKSLKNERDDGFTEAQIYGPLTKKDFDYIVVNCRGFGEVSHERLEELKRLLPVYSCKETGWRSKPHPRVLFIHPDRLLNPS